MESRKYYIDGNTVRVTEMPRPAERPSVRPQVEPKPKTAPKKLNLPYMLTLMLVTVLFGFLCWQYLNLQDGINASAKHIAEMEVRLYDLKNDNAVLDNRLEAQLDLDEVYRVATEELGMVYPDGNTTVLYAASVREYVRQYDDVPAN